MAYRTLRLEHHDRVLLVRLDNPPRNLLNTSVIDELTHLVRAVEADDAVRVVVITGEPHEVFTAHFDVEEIQDLSRRLPFFVPPHLATFVWTVLAGADRVPAVDALIRRSPAAGASALLRMHRLFTAMGRSATVFVAALNGTALGGGLELALACDLRVMAASETTHIGLPEGLIGILPGGGGTQRLTRLVGPGRALHLMLDGSPLSAQQALDLGVVHAVAAPEQLIATALAIAQRMSRRSPWTVQMLKRSVYGGIGRPLRTGLLLENVGLVVTTTSRQGRVGMRALLERFPSQRPTPIRDVLEALSGSATSDLGGR
ncbi:enoyl-CoA hydratase/isomerase family protein [Kineococcus sp. SYSU DK001]|uniref:enoyl-CoA hydratase/isomerase family protein n=1 Tax=Kineococcus sp. SYSU DK001 TaxID=3383122 RepID=UPI003D7D48CE